MGMIITRFELHTHLLLSTHVGFVWNLFIRGMCLFGIYLVRFRFSVVVLNLLR